MDKILIADSSAQNAELMSECLQDEDFEIITCGSGFVAMAKIDVFKPDLVIIDYDLPDLSGCDLCKRIKSDKETKYTLVLITSLDDSRTVQTRSYAMGADGFLEKSFDSLILNKRVRSLLEIKHLREQAYKNYVELEKANEKLTGQLKMGRLIQRSILTKINETIHGLKFYSKYIPEMDIGGDFYGVYELDAYRAVAVMGDVSGHGIGAALLTAMSCLIVRNLCMDCRSPELLLHRLNTEFCKIFEHSDQEMYACVFCAIFDTREQKIYYSNAGGTPPVFVDAKNNAAWEMESSGVPVGLMKNSRYERHELSYNAGDLIMLQTDGLCDTFYKHDPDEYFSRLKELLLDCREVENLKEIVDILLGSFYNYNVSDEEIPDLDDVTVILCKM